MDVNVDVGFQRWSTNWGHRKLRSTNQRKSNQIVFDESLRKTGVPGEKISRCIIENQPTQLKYDAESGNRSCVTWVGGEYSHHSAIPATLKSCSQMLKILSVASGSSRSIFLWNTGFSSKETEVLPASVGK